MSSSSYRDVILILIVVLVLIRCDPEGCLKIYMVEFDCKMGTGSNQDQLRNVVVIILLWSMVIIW